MKTDKYTLESLREGNYLYDQKHTAKPRDVEVANRYVRLIEKGRSDTTPRVCDLVRFTDRHGSYYPHAHIESFEKGRANIRCEPYYPWVYETKYGGLGYTFGGGLCTDLPAGELRYAGKEQKGFKEWGHCGSCANGAFSFSAEVSVWEYREPDPFYGDFSMKDWRKIYIHKKQDSDPEDCSLYQGEGCCCRTEEKFRTFLAKYKGTVFPGNWHTQLVVWCYRERRELLSREEWDALPYPVGGRNHDQKTAYDDTTHELITYEIRQ